MPWKAEVDESVAELLAKKVALLKDKLKIYQDLEPQFGTSKVEVIDVEMAVIDAEVELLREKARLGR